MSENYNDKSRWIKMPLAELTTPKPGRLCKGTAWWAITEDNCVLFFKRYGSPQCNVDRSIVKRIRPDLEQVYVESAFIPHDCREYV